MAEDSCMFCGATPCECGAGKKPAAKPQPKKISKRVPKSQPQPNTQSEVETSVRTRKPKATAAPPPSSKRTDPFEEPVRTLHFFGMLSKEAVKEHEHRLVRKRPTGTYTRREEAGDGGIGSDSKGTR